MGSLRPLGAIGPSLVADSPVCAAVVWASLAFSVFLRRRGASVDSVACSYAKVVQEKQLWRIFVSQFAHADFMYLGIVVLATIQAAEVEIYWGSALFAQKSLVMMLATTGLHLLHVRSNPLRGSIFEFSSNHRWSGLSGLVLAWHTVMKNFPYQADDSTMMLLTLFPVPVDHSSDVLFGLLYLLAGRFSFADCVSGITVGILMVIGLFDWLTPYLSICLLQWCFVACIASNGFPPELESEEMFRQRRAEERFAASVRPGQSQDENFSDLEAGTRGNRASRTHHDEFAHLMELNVEIPSNLQR